MPGGRAGAVPPPPLLLLLLALPGPGAAGENTELPTFWTEEGPHSILEDTASPALSAAVIVIITIIVSGSAYLCFLKYVCSGCSKATQVVPSRRLDPSRSEEEEV